MLRVLPKAVVRFLLDNPQELQTVKHRMQAVKELRARWAREKAEMARRAKLPLQQCTALPYTNCQNMTPGGYICDDCAAEYRDDPDTFK